ncbi:MAG: hypothetical protein DRN17_02580 [Thermoplasmata archaeon]|nr:MAG: hypothetical protein DRN17_02580 [Thermoplasmata archaeon]
MMDAKVVGYPEGKSAVNPVYAAKQGRKSFPKNPIKEILGQECNPYQISMDSVIITKNFLEELTIRVAKLAKKRMDEYNTSRKAQGLEEIKRLPGWIVEEVIHNILKELDVIDTGLQHDQNELRSPGSENMSAQTNTVKPDKTTDDRREVV